MKLYTSDRFYRPRRARYDAAIITSPQCPDCGARAFHNGECLDCKERQAETAYTLDEWKRMRAERVQ